MSGHDLNSGQHAARRLQLAPGDIVVYEAPVRVAEAVKKSIRKEIDELIPGQKVLFVDGGAKLAILGKPVADRKSSETP